MAFLLLAAEAKSQTTGPFHIGLKGGANFSTLSVSREGLTSKYTPGFSAGLMGRLDISKMYLQSELLYSRKGTGLEQDNSGNQKTKWNSIEIPVLVGYKILSSENTNLRIFGGGVYSYILNDKVSVLPQVKNSFADFDKSNIGYQVGAGIDVGKLTFDFRYEGGLNNLSKDFKSRPNSFQVSVGFMIF